MIGLIANHLSSYHRAARNYKTEIKNSLDEIFSEKEDVRPFYAIAFLHYRLEFLWRNQKIDSGMKIYRYYFIDAIVRSIIGNKSFTGLKDRAKIKFSEELLKIAENEANLIKIVTQTNRILNKKVKDLGHAATRERLRDSIRSESFFVNARQDYLPKNPVI